MISLKKICKHYQYQGETVKVLTDVDLEIARGESVCIRAPSGRGKTTLLSIIGGMLTPSSGTVMVNGMNLTEIPGHFLSSFRRDNIGFIFQQFHLLQNFTVMENLLFPLIPKGGSLPDEMAKIEILLERLQVLSRRDFTVNLLSGGEQQRVAVARALVNDPAIIIADEPFSQLDGKNSGLISDLFSELRQRGKTIVLSASGERSPWEEALSCRDISQ